MADGNFKNEKPIAKAIVDQNYWFEVTTAESWNNEKYIILNRYINGLPDRALSFPIGYTDAMIKMLIFAEGKLENDIKKTNYKIPKGIKFF